VVAQNSVAVLPAMCPRHAQQRCNGDDQCNRESDPDEHHAIIPWRINWVKPERHTHCRGLADSPGSVVVTKVTQIWNEKSAETRRVVP